jgi:hypothetical protein
MIIIFKFYIFSDLKIILFLQFVCLQHIIKFFYINSFKLIYSLHYPNTNNFWLFTFIRICHRLKVKLVILVIY